MPVRDVNAGLPGSQGFPGNTGEGPITADWSAQDCASTETVNCLPTTRTAGLHTLWAQQQHLTTAACAGLAVTGPTGASGGPGAGARGGAHDAAELPMHFYRLREAADVLVYAILSAQCFAWHLQVLQDRQPHVMLSVSCMFHSYLSASTRVHATLRN